MFYLGLRVEELTFLRRRDVHLGLKVVYVPGTKTASAERYVPIQKAYEPWLLDLLERASLDSLTPIFQNSDLTGPARPDSFRGRVRRVLEEVGLKRPGRLTHIFRASRITIAQARGLSRSDMDRFVGHGDTSIAGRHYLDPSVFAASLRDHRFTYLPELASPAGVEILLEDWRRRRR